MASKTSRPINPGSFAGIHQEATSDTSFRQGLELPFRVNFTGAVQPAPFSRHFMACWQWAIASPALMLMYSSKGEFATEVTKINEDAAGFMLQGGVSVMGAVQGNYMHQFNKRLSFNASAMSSPPAKFMVNGMWRYEGDNYTACLDLNLDEEQELMSIKEVIRKRAHAGANILHNVPLVPGLAAGVSVKWRSYGPPRVALGARYELAVKQNSKHHNRAYAIGLTADSLGTAEASMNCTAFTSPESDYSFSTLFRVSQSKGKTKSKLFVGVAHTSPMLRWNCGVDLDGSLGGSLNLGPLGLGAYYSKAEGPKFSIELVMAPGF